MAFRAFPFVLGLASAIIVSFADGLTKVVSAMRWSSFGLGDGLPHFVSPITFARPFVLLVGTG